MKAKFVHVGKQIDLIPQTAIAANSVVLFGTVPMIAERAIAAGELGALSSEGVFDIEKDSSAITAGDAIYWDVDGSPVEGVALSGAASGDNSLGYLMGLAVEDAAAEGTTVRVKLTAAKRTTTIAGSVTADDITGSDASLGIAGLQAAQGGAVVISGGVSTTAGNAGGAVTIIGGTPGSTGVGGAVIISGRPGGSAGGAGGAVTVTGGDGTAANANGGALSILGGNAHGSGTDGALGLGTSNTSAISVGAASIATTLTGALNKTAGESTAADGSDNTDAGALPAGTATVYPTTAADNTKGVIVNAADKVTGRLLLIGNGVSDKVLKVYPPAGGTINGAGANVAFSSVSGKGVILYCLSSGDNTWLAW